MTSRPATTCWRAALCALLLASAQAQAAEELAAEPALALDVQSAGPIDGARNLGLVSGRAVAGSEAGTAIDVVFVLDASAKTVGPSGADIDGDGRASRQLLRRLLARSGGRAGGDSILAAEIAAALELLAQLDPRSTRVAVVAYAGGAAGSADDAWVQVELTSRFDRVQKGLGELLELYEPGGSSDLPAGLRVGRLELQNGEPRPDAQRHLVLVSAGFPESPRETSVQTEQVAIGMAKRLGKERTRVHAYAVGESARLRPRAAVKVAEHSGGKYVELADPAALVNVLPEIDLAEIAELGVRHLGTGEPALEQVLYPDGTYAAVVALRPGTNPIEVHARATSGAEKSVRIEIQGDDPALYLQTQPELERALRRLPELRRRLEIEPETSE
jgi:hypothetical protein